MKSKFINVPRPNKQLVMSEMYHEASKHIHQTNVVILPSAYPFLPLRRLFRYGIVGKKSKIYGYEFDRSAAAKWLIPSKKDKPNKSNIYEIEKRLNVVGYPLSVEKMLKFRIGNVASARAQQFMDLDFCLSWITSRNIDKGLHDPNSPIRLMLDAISKQKVAFPNKHKVLIGTVSLRNAIGGKDLTSTYLSAVVKRATGGEVALIDGQKEAYKEGKRISTEGCLQAGRRFHAYKHEVIITKGVDATLSMYTYKDTTNMLSFILTYK